MKPIRKKKMASYSRKIIYFIILILGKTSFASWASLLEAAKTAAEKENVEASHQASTEIRISSASKSADSAIEPNLNKELIPKKKRKRRSANTVPNTVLNRRLIAAIYLLRHPHLLNRKMWDKKKPYAGISKVSKIFDIAARTLRRNFFACVLSGEELKSEQERSIHAIVMNENPPYTLAAYMPEYVGLFQGIFNPAEFKADVVRKEKMVLSQKLKQTCTSATSKLKGKSHQDALRLVECIQKFIGEWTTWYNEVPEHMTPEVKRYLYMYRSTPCVASTIFHQFSKKYLEKLEEGSWTNKDFLTSAFVNQWLEELQGNKSFKMGKPPTLELSKKTYVNLSAPEAMQEIRRECQAAIVDWEKEIAQKLSLLKALLKPIVRNLESF